MDLQGCLRPCWKLALVGNHYISAWSSSVPTFLWLPCIALTAPAERQNTFVDSQLLQCVVPAATGLLTASRSTQKASDGTDRGVPLGVCEHITRLAKALTLVSAERLRAWAREPWPRKQRRRTKRTMMCSLGLPSSARTGTRIMFSLARIVARTDIY